jgi:eukaryotic-like serine/threonine-protein kinase
VIYMSPEQLKASTEVDPRSDIWSLGIILFELLAGRAPFEGTPQMIAVNIASKEPPDVRTFVPEVPEAVAAVIATMLQRNPNQRFSSCRDVALALAPFADPSSVGASLIPLLSSMPSVRPASAGKTLPLSQLQKHTLPLVNRPSASGPVPPSTAPLVARAAKSASARAAATVQIRRGSPTFGPMAAGALLGVLTALLVVLIVFALRKKDGAAERGSGPGPSITSAPASAAPLRAAPSAPSSSTEPRASSSSTTASPPAPLPIHSTTGPRPPPPLRPPPSSAPQSNPVLL